MKSIIACAAMLLASLPAAAADVGISINVGEPGFFGQINIGNVPEPAVIYPQPVIVERAPGYAEQPPIYLRVPPGHERHWDKHCREYNACGRRVLFVRDDWYQNEYVPRYRHEHEARDRHFDRKDERRDDHEHREHDRDDHGRDHG